MRLSQLAARPRRLIPSALLAAGLTRRPVPAWQSLPAGIGVNPAPQSGPTPPPHETHAFAAVGAERRFGAPGFWTDQSDGLLFLFALHGFAGLAEYAGGDRTPAGDRFWATVIEAWLERYTTAKNPAWHPYPTSQRVIAWAAAMSAIGEWPDDLRERMAAELWRQAWYLRRCIEHDIGGNHVLKNATALTVAGAVFPSSKLSDRGLVLLRRELGRQLLPDGGHEERSPSYHREVLGDLGDVVTVLECSGRVVPSWLSAAVSAATAWQAQMTGPDGSLPLLNDSWEGPAAPSADEDRESRLEPSGYVVCRSGPDQVIFDVGPVSPPHLPPHAHADVLSVVLWADGRPVLVDPGSFAYTGPLRRAFRSTRAHNTVEVDGRDQCELWGDFRVAYPPNVRAAPLRRHGNDVLAAGSHDGYRRLADPVIHSRIVIWCPGDGLIVLDMLRARQPHQVVSSLHLAPGIEHDGVERIGPFPLVALGPGASLGMRTGSYAPYLGTKVEATLLEDQRVMSPEVPFGFSLLRGARQVAELSADQIVLAGGGQAVTTIPLEWA